MNIQDEWALKKHEVDPCLERLMDSLIALEPSTLRKVIRALVSELSFDTRKSVCHSILSDSCRSQNARKMNTFRHGNRRKIDGATDGNESCLMATNSYEHAAAATKITETRMFCAERLLESWQKSGTANP